VGLGCRCGPPVSPLSSLHRPTHQGILTPNSYSRACAAAAEVVAVVPRLIGLVAYRCCCNACPPPHMPQPSCPPRVAKSSPSSVRRRARYRCAAVMLGMSHSMTSMCSASPLPCMRHLGVEPPIRARVGCLPYRHLAHALRRVASSVRHHVHLLRGHQRMDKTMPLRVRVTLPLPLPVPASAVAHRTCTRCGKTHPVTPCADTPAQACFASCSMPIKGPLYLHLVRPSPPRSLLQ
jgi:hypothetical protein